MELAQEYNVSPGTIRNRLREHNKKAYDQIAKTRTSPKSNGHRRNLPPSAKLYEEWAHGKSIRDLAKKYKVSRQTITRRLKEHNEQEYKKIAKKKIAASINERRKKLPPPNRILIRWLRGESTYNIAKRFHVSRQTIARILRKHAKKIYDEIVQDRINTARTKEIPLPLDEIFEKLENGEPSENLEKQCKISYRQLSEKLKAHNPVRYKQVAERRGLGSARAKRLGARSNFELKVRRILEKHGIHTKETTLKLGKHNYRPDFPLLERNTIIEAMGLNMDSYWKRNKRKIKDYLRHKYKVIAVVPNEQIYKNAKNHLNKKVKILRSIEFEQFVATSLEKVPDAERFSVNQKAVANNRLILKAPSLSSSIILLAKKRGERSSFDELLSLTPSRRIHRISVDQHQAL